MSKKYFEELIELIKAKKPNKKQLNRLKNKVCSKYKRKTIPSDIEILLNADAKDVPKIRKYLLTKPTRTISGVAVCAIMTKPIKCKHGKCYYCPGGPDSVFGSIPQSYTGKEPATRRAIRNRFDAYLQTMNRLEQYVVSGHVPDKIELILMGGTFPSFPKKYQEDFVKYSLKAMNDFSRLFFKNNKFNFLKFKKFFELPAKDLGDKERLKRIHNQLLSIKKENKKLKLETIQKNNEKSKIKCVGLTIETRPDYGKLKQGNEMLRLGCTRVELGVQTVYDNVLKKVRRGHTVKDSIESIKTLRDLGFKLNFHIMPGLPGVSREKDFMGLIELFRNSDFRPDMLKIYPCMVLKGTKLYMWWKQHRYKPLTTKKAAELIAEFKQFVPRWVRIMRVQRDIPTFMTEAGVGMTNLRQYIEKVMKKQKIKCECIRCREPRGRNISNKTAISTAYYEASDGNEFFISADDIKNDIILGFCRLRFPSQSLRKEIKEDSALIRELHVYGEAAEIGKRGKVQHKGIGKALMETAEETAKTYNRNKMIVISGIGAREYFRKLGYKQEGPYMVKKLK
ncbi:tRNA uridine(34) 5-carboxymethylaminomethyl modification radical SAM/GNAT enzyme Elp3 [Candidatus Woesearchaeota archaeon]|nr:tRNA uridine(34) 5-carboxymethylaminomethyl modification radical SAM/GNAT enzyme Elp3 [Candidatus Woesearchaeota archaeon]